MPFQNEILPPSETRGQTHTHTHTHAPIMAAIFNVVADGGGGGFESIGSSAYFLGGSSRPRAPPAGVPSNAAPSARQPNRPGQQTPGAKTPIPTSSAKPGNRENQRIPYSRLMFTSLDDTAAPRKLQWGDVIFVHKTSASLGRGTNRPVKATGLPQLNAMLAKQSTGVTTAPLTLAADPALLRRVLAIRNTEAANMRKTAEHELAHETARHAGAGSASQGSAARIVDLQAKLTAATEAEAQAKDALEKGVPVAGSEAFNPFTDWAALTLGDWTLDGVLINTEGEDEFASESPMLSRSDGVLLNVCVQGPTPLRNSAPTEADVQVIDQRITCMDQVFVGLFSEQREFTVSTKNADGTTSTVDREEVGFQLKLFSGAQAHAGAAQFQRLCGAWRVGSVMDSRLTTGTSRMITVNMCAEWWDAERLVAKGYLA